MCVCLNLGFDVSCLISPSGEVCMCVCVCGNIVMSICEINSDESRHVVGEKRVKN